MYGTTMIAHTQPGRQDDLLEACQRWLRERGQQVEGFVDEEVLLSDDGTRVVVAARFSSKEAYSALSADSAQDEFYRRHIAPLVDGDVQWIDGTWHDVTG